MKAIRTATIQHSMDFGSKPEVFPPRRVRLNFRKDGDKYRWYGIENGEEFDTEISASNVEEAKEAALEAWSGWGLNSTWGSTELRQMNRPLTCGFFYWRLHNTINSNHKQAR